MRQTTTSTAWMLARKNGTQPIRLHAAIAQVNVIQGLIIDASTRYDMTQV